jgi:hypothetical protein
LFLELDCARFCLGSEYSVHHQRWADSR